MYNEYDLRNQLVYTRTADGTEVRSTYNGEGYRVAKSVKAPGEAQGKITYFLYEGDKVILELDSNRNQTGRNVYGTNLLFRTVGNRNSGTTYSYIYNGHGDVTALITDAGYVAATYRYDAFGNIIESTGNVDNSIRYAGYQYDVETGLYYINARMYDPLTARFLQEDTYTGNPNDPLSLNLYTYCHNDPVSYDDPTGHKRKNIVQKWVAKAKKAVKKTAKKAVSAVKKEIKKTVAKEKARSKEAAKQYEKKAATVKVVVGKVDAKPNNYLEGGSGPQKTKTVLAKLEKTTLVDGIQTLLDAVGLVPAIGEPCDAINGAIYLAKGDKVNAAWSAAACLPIGGQLATVGKFINKGAKVDDVYDVVKAAAKVADATGAEKDVYAGVKEASEYLKSQNVPREYRKQILESFDVRTIKMETAGDSTYGIRFYGGDAQEKGRYLFETFSPTTNRNNLALPNEWNSMTGLQQFQVKSETSMITGNAASQLQYGSQYVGGAKQGYINSLEALSK